MIGGGLALRRQLGARQDAGQVDPARSGFRVGQAAFALFKSGETDVLPVGGDGRTAVEPRADQAFAVGGEGGDVIGQRPSGITAPVLFGGQVKDIVGSEKIPLIRAVLDGGLNPGGGDEALADLASGGAEGFGEERGATGIDRFFVGDERNFADAALKEKPDRLFGGVEGVESDRRNGAFVIVLDQHPDHRDGERQFLPELVEFVEQNDRRAALVDPVPAVVEGVFVAIERFDQQRVTAGDRRRLDRGQRGIKDPAPALIRIDDHHGEATAGGIAAVGRRGRADENPALGGFADQTAFDQKVDAAQRRIVADAELHRQPPD